MPFDSDLKIVTIVEINEFVTDALSQCPDHINEEEMKAKEIKQTMITKDMVINAINTSWADKITELLPLDKFAKIIYDGLKHGKLPL